MNAEIKSHPTPKILVVRSSLFSLYDKFKNQIKETYKFQGDIVIVNTVITCSDEDVLDEYNKLQKSKRKLYNCIMQFEKNQSKEINESKQTKEYTELLNTFNEYRINCSFFFVLKPSINGYVNQKSDDSSSRFVNQKNEEKNTDDKSSNHDLTNNKGPKNKNYIIESIGVDTTNMGYYLCGEPLNFKSLKKIENNLHTLNHFFV